MDPVVTHPATPPIISSIIYVLQEPIFCIETMIKMFYMSALIYDYTEAQGHQFSTLPSEVREVLGDMEHAMQFYGLSKRRMFYDRSIETKILIAWSASTIVLSFRGSITRANYVADVKVCSLNKSGFRVPGTYTIFQYGSAISISIPIVLSFCGSITRANYVADVKVCSLNNRKRSGGGG